MLPWWACMALAIVNYLVLSALARPVAVTAVRPGDIAHMATQAMWKAFAYAGQFIVPFACIIAAVVSAYRRHERDQLVSNVTDASSSDALGDMTWREFEVLVGEGFRLGLRGQRHRWRWCLRRRRSRSAQGSREVPGPV